MINDIDWQARAVAAEVALVTIEAELRHISEGKTEEIRDDRSSGESTTWCEAHRHVVGVLPDLSAARELIRKAGEADEAEDTRDSYRRVYSEACVEIDRIKCENIALAALVVELRGALEDIAEDGFENSRDRRTLIAKAALALPLPEAAKRAAEWKEKADLLDWIIEQGSIFVHPPHDVHGWRAYPHGGSMGSGATAIAALKAARGTK